MTKSNFIWLIWASFCLINSLTAQTYQANWASLDSRPVPAWFEDAKFGIFIHWGIYAVPSYSPTRRDSVGVYERYAEWYWRRWRETGKNQKFFTDFHNRSFGAQVRYQDLVKDFKAEFYNPDDWAERFKQAGAQYIVFTSKHHEGFPLWQSKQSWMWNAVDVGPHRDLLGDLTQAVRNKGLKMGYYYSLLEWYHPLYKRETIEQYVDEHMLPQMKDLVTRYKPDVFWTDGEWDYRSDTLKSPQFLAWLFNESPVKNTVAINDRWGKETRSKHGGYYTTEYDMVHSDNSEGMSFSRPWEECRGMAGSFGYNRNENLEDYSTAQELIHILIDKVARGGNLLLNIGPTADGRIPVIMQQRLAEMGKWLAVNGDAIYGTRKWDKAPKVDKNTRLFFTKKANDLYVITTQWQETLSIENINAPSKVQFLGLNTEVKSQFKNGKLTISTPSVSPATVPCQHAWVFKLTGALK
jgi:alpha-L-fucosidase